ncbi:HAD family hydrolase [uncultured Martelella sp.]|uniref:HAD family hydrolase n=1 Tax=uncultured Martelella sp. TaxID=392331 RepID=UPI0029C6B651|nr:HAD family hydrolase [uncultured Martelella sp.]
MIIFLDVDGTYADHGVVPEANAAAVRAARSRGHRVLLCTGRPACMLPPSISGAGFDGVVASAGAYVEVGGKVLRDRRFPQDLAEKAVSVLDAYRVAYLLEAPENLSGPADIAERLATVFGRLKDRSGAPRSTPAVLGEVLSEPHALTTPFSKITVFESSVPVPRLGEMIGAEVATLPSSMPDMGSSAGEIFLADEHKERGARLAADAFGAEVQDIVAVGDGYNDLEMLSWAGTGVAIEGAPPAVLAVADMTTPGPQHGGLATLFARLGLT